MITSLTKEQEAKIPEFIAKWVNKVSEPTDRKEATKVVQSMYAKMGEEKPVVIFGESPYSTALMASLVFMLIDPKNKEQLGSQLHSQLDSQLRNINKDWYSSIWWLAWSGWYDYGQYIGVEFDKEKYDLFMAFVSNVGFIIPYKGNAFVSEAPEKIYWDEQGRLSYDHDMSVRYKDGWGLYCLDGVTFEKNEWQKITNQELTLEDMQEAAMGADKSAVAFKYLRADRLLEHCKAKLIHTGSPIYSSANVMRVWAKLNGHKIGTTGKVSTQLSEKYAAAHRTKLYEVKNFMDTGETEYCMRMTHPTIDREYIEWVPPKVGKQGDADLAQCAAWTDKDGDPIPLEDYHQLVMS